MVQATIIYILNYSSLLKCEKVLHTTIPLPLHLIFPLVARSVLKQNLTHASSVPQALQWLLMILGKSNLNVVLCCVLFNSPLFPFPPVHSILTRLTTFIFRSWLSLTSLLILSSFPDLPAASSFPPNNLNMLISHNLRDHWYFKHWIVFYRCWNLVISCW